MSKLSTYLSPIITLVIIFIMWEFLVNLFSIETYILPAPSDIIYSLSNNLSTKIITLPIVSAEDDPAAPRK